MNDSIPEPRDASLRDAHSARPVVVVKVGGSLLDMPELAGRLESFLGTLGDSNVILTVGGGPAVDLVRDRDRFDEFGDDKSHWLAVRALTFNSYLLEGLLENSRVVARIAQCATAWDEGRVPILDPHTFLTEDAGTRSPLPQTWQVTSDSIAARVAGAAGASELVLLKSVSWSGGDMSQAVRQSIVDEHLPRELARSPNLRVRIVNLRYTGLA